MSKNVARGIRSAQAGLLTNAGLALIELLAGILGNSYALVADAIESTADIFSSLIVWGGLRIVARAPDADYPFGYGKAESLAATVVSSGNDSGPIVGRLPTWASYDCHRDADERSRRSDRIVSVVPCVGLHGCNQDDKSESGGRVVRSSNFNAGQAIAA